MTSEFLLNYPAGGYRGRRNEGTPRWQSDVLSHRPGVDQYIAACASPTASKYVLPPPPPPFFFFFFVCCLPLWVIHLDCPPIVLTHYKWRAAWAMIETFNPPPPSSAIPPPHPRLGVKDRVSITCLPIFPLVWRLLFLKPRITTTLGPVISCMELQFRGFLNRFGNSFVVVGKKKEDKLMC